MRRSVDSRLIPFGVNSHVLCGHSLAVKGVCLSARRVGVPTAKRERIGKRGRSRGSIAARIGNALLVIVRSSFYRNAVIDINDIIAVAVIIEFCAGIRSAIFCTVLQIAGEAGHFVSFLIGDGTAGITSIRVIQLISLPACVFCTTFAGQNLNIIVCRTAALCLAVEFLAAKGHGIKVGLRRGLIVLSNIPERADRPLRADIGAVLRSYGLRCDPAIC